MWLNYNQRVAAKGKIHHRQLSPMDFFPFVKTISQESLLEKHAKFNLNDQTNLLQMTNNRQLTIKILFSTFHHLSWSTSTLTDDGNRSHHALRRRGTRNSFNAKVLAKRIHSFFARCPKCSHEPSAIAWARRVTPGRVRRVMRGKPEFSHKIRVSPILR